MGVPLRDLHQPPGLLTRAELERILARLPARQRAQFQWMGPLFHKIVGALHAGLPSPDALADGVVDFFRIARAAAPLIETVRAERGPDAVRAVVSALETDWRARLDALRAYLPDASAADSAEWALRAVAVTFQLTLAAEPPDAMLSDPAAWQLPGGDVVTFARLPAAGLLRAQILLIALLEAAAESRPLAHAADLAHLSCVEAQEGVRALRREGIALDPFADETFTERNARVTRAVGQLRDGLDEATHTCLFPDPPAAS